MFGRDRVLPGLVAAIGVALSTLVYVAADRWQAAEAWQLAEEDADAMVESLRQNLGLRTARLAMIQAVFAARKAPVSRAEFAALAARVLPGDPVSYVEPSSAGATPGGARPALDHAFATGTVTASPPLPLAPSDPAASGMMLYAPVAVSGDGRNGDRRALIAAPIRFDAVMAEAGRVAARHGPLAVLDVTEGKAVVLFGGAVGAGTGGESVARELEVAGRRWRVVRPIAMGWRERLMAWGGFGLGLAMTGLSTALVVGVRRRRREAMAAAQRLANALAAAERASIAKTHVLDSASHDLRQPLQALRLFVDYLQHRLSGSEVEPIIRQVDQALGSTQSLIEEVLEVSRLEKGSVVPMPRHLDLSSLLAEVVEEFRPLAEHKGLDLRARLPVIWASTDAALLRRLVRNLVANALRFTEGGGVLVGVRRRGGRPGIEVWDTGIGIPADHLPLIWDDLYQVGNQARQRVHGLGLGLSIVRRLAEALGAELEVSSSPGRGSVFRVTLPDPLARQMGL